MTKPIEPKYPKIWFGCGTQGLIIRQIRRTDRDGITWYFFWIRPTKTMMSYWGIRDTELDEEGCIPARPYKASNVEILGEEDPSVKTYFIKETYQWGETNMTQDTKSIMIERLQKAVRAYKNALISKEAELSKILSRQQEWAREQNELKKEIGGREEITMPEEYPPQNLQ